MASKAGKTRYGLVCYGLLWCFYIFCWFCIILKQKFVILFLKHILNSDVRKPMNDGWMDDVCMYKRADICVYGSVSLYTYLTYVCKVCAHNEHQNKIEITTIMRIKVEYWWNKLKSYRKTQFEYKIKKLFQPDSITEHRAKHSGSYWFKRAFPKISHVISLQWFLHCKLLKNFSPNL